MKKLTLILLFVSSFAFGQTDPLWQRDSTKLDTVLINSFSQKTKPYNQETQRNIWVVEKNILSLSQAEKSLLFGIILKLAGNHIFLLKKILTAIIRSIEMISFTFRLAEGTMQVLKNQRKKF